MMQNDCCKLMVLFQKSWPYRVKCAYQEKVNHGRQT